MVCGYLRDNDFLGARKEKMREEVGLHWKYLSSDGSRRRELFPDITSQMYLNLLSGLPGHPNTSPFYR